MWCINPFFSVTVSIKHPSSLQKVNPILTGLRFCRFLANVAPYTIHFEPQIKFKPLMPTTLVSNRRFDKSLTRKTKKTGSQKKYQITRSVTSVLFLVNGRPKMEDGPWRLPKPEQTCYCWGYDSCAASTVNCQITPGHAWTWYLSLLRP